MSTKNLDSFASAELAEDALETVSGGAKTQDRAVAVQTRKQNDRAVVQQSAQTKEGKLMGNFAKQFGGKDVGVQVSKQKF